MNEGGIGGGNRTRPNFGKDNDARAGLEQGLNLGFNMLADEGLGVVDDHHRAIGEITDALSLVLAFADDFQVQGFTGEQNDFEAFGDFMEVHVIDLLQLGNLGEIVVVGVEPGVEVACQADEFGVHFLFLGKIAIVNAHFDVGVALDTIEHFESAAAAGAFDGVTGIGDLLEFSEHKTRHDDQAFEEMGLNQIGDAPINDDAGIEQQQVVRLVLRREPDERNDEREILLVAAHGEDDADVAETEEQAEPDEPAGFFLGIFEQAGTVNEDRDEHAEQEAKGRCRKGAERKALEHFVQRNQQSAEAEADDHADERAVFLADEFRPDLADGVAARRAERQKQKPSGPEWSHIESDR